MEGGTLRVLIWLRMVNDRGTLNVLLSGCFFPGVMEKMPYPAVTFCNGSDSISNTISRLHVVITEKEFH